MDARVQALGYEVMEVGGDARITMVRVRCIDVKHDNHRETIIVVQDVQVETTTQVHYQRRGSMVWSNEF